MLQIVASLNSKFDTCEKADTNLLNSLIETLVIAKLLQIVKF